MKKVVTILAIIILSFSTNVYAHPGRTDSNGCHTCKTNCEKYGLEDGEYHCHNNTSSSSDNSSSTTTKSTTKKTITTQSTTKKIETYGCMNSEAINYNSQATLSDGSCQFEIISTIKEVIPFETKIIGKESKQKTITQKGQSGVKEITETKIIDENNNVISTQTRETIIEKPVTEIIEYQTISQKEEASSISLIIFIIPYLIPLIYSKKHSNIFMIINKIKQYNSKFKYLFYFLYILNPLVLIIDIFLIIKNIFTKKQF